MKYFTLLGLLLFFVAACQSDADTNADAETQVEAAEVVELRNKVAQLELESNRKDSVLNETFAFFNEVQTNLLKINVKEDEIRVKSSNPELTQEDQEWILQEISNINFLRTQNAKSIASLQKQLSAKDLKINELEDMVEGLVRQIQIKDEQIVLLQNRLSDIDMEYANLFDEYQEQVELALDVIKEMNTVYYAYGTESELIENKVLMKEGGFIGIGRQTNIADDFNEKYFQKMDKTKIKEIKIVGKQPKLATDHPVSSYEWSGDKLIIKDANKFWRISNYLVVIVK
ncbi:MAG TPA: hypothetical protein VKX31_08585 [Brumimicrobium sp.]|nr:hypothetical protein [Brumimicrobium sp.]